MTKPTLEWIENEAKNRDYFRDTFTSESGKIVLTQILNYCGCFSTTPGVIRPELLAFGNWILSMCGIIHPANLYLYTEKLAEAANDEDLLSMRKELNKREENDEVV